MIIYYILEGPLGQEIVFFSHFNVGHDDLDLDDSGKMSR